MQLACDTSVQKDRIMQLACNTSVQVDRIMQLVVRLHTMSVQKSCCDT